MPRYKDADALRKAMYHEAFEKDSDEQRWDSGCWIRYKLFERVFDSVPTIDVPDRKVGEWKLNKDGNWACPFCKFDPYHDNMKGMNYCPNCGARMKGEDDAEIH